MPERRDGRAAAVLSVRGAAQLHNLKGIDVEIPLGKFVVVSGVSGSGKSHARQRDRLQVARRRLAKLHIRPGGHDGVEGDRGVRQGDRHRPVADRAHAAVEPRDLHRAVHAHPRAARDARGEGARLQAGPVLASTSRAGAARPARATGRSRSRCTSSPTSTCRARRAKGKRYNRETLEVHYKGKTHRRRAGDDGRGGARALRERSRKIRRQLQTLHDVGLGYMTLGQPATTLSGGEAQRVKLAAELGQARDRANALHPRRADDRPALRRHRASCSTWSSAWSTAATRCSSSSTTSTSSRRPTGSSTSAPRAARRRRDRRGGHARGRSRRASESYTGRYLRRCSARARRRVAHGARRSVRSSAGLGAVAVSRRQAAKGAESVGREDTVHHTAAQDGTRRLARDPAARPGVPSAAARRRSIGVRAGASLVRAARP